MTERQVDQEKLNAFLGKFVGDLAATAHGATVIIGDRLGLYSALKHPGGLTSTELAKRTDTVERYVREWLAAQAAAGYVTYDAKSNRYSLSPEQEFTLTNEAGTVFVPAGTSTARSSLRARASSSAPGTRRTWCPRGCRPWTGSWPDSSAARRWRMWAAVSGPRPF